MLILLGTTLQIVKDVCNLSNGMNGDPVDGKEDVARQVLIRKMLMSIRARNKADDAKLTKARMRMKHKPKSFGGRKVRDMVIDQRVGQPRRNVWFQLTQFLTNVHLGIQRKGTASQHVSCRTAITREFIKI